MSSLFLSNRLDKRALFIAAGLALFLYFSLSARHRYSSNALTRNSFGWEFNAAHDERNYGLSDEQCDQAFPGLFQEIDKIADTKRRKGNITRFDIDRSADGDDNVRVLIFDRQIYILSDRCIHHRNRAASIISSMYRAILAYPGDIPNVEFVLSVADGPNGRNQWGLTYDLEEKNKDHTWLISDHGWFTWPVPLLGEYTQIRKEIAMKEPAWENKTAQVAWRGVVGLAGIRQGLLDASEGKEWNNVKGMGWAGNGGMEGGNDESKKFVLKASEHCNFQYLAYTEGATYSGRFKYLHNCNSVIITHKLKWAEWHGSLMVFNGTDQNMVQVERDWSDLSEKMEWLLSHPEEAKRIAANNAKTFRDRYMTPAAQACYSRRMVKSWASVQAFEPALWERKREGDGDPEWKIRGEPYETWMIKPMV